MVRNPVPRTPVMSARFKPPHRGSLSPTLRVGPAGTEEFRLTESGYETRATHYDQLRNPAFHSGNLSHTTSRRPGILVVDDDLGVRNMLSAGLWQHGFMVWLAGDGPQALELYRALRAEIDLVVLDVRMPGMDGPLTLTALQRLDPEVRCCFMSGNIGPYTEEELLERGALRVVLKPFRLPEFAQLLWQLVSPREAENAGHALGSVTEGSTSELFLG